MATVVTTVVLTNALTASATAASTTPDSPALIVTVETQATQPAVDATTEAPDLGARANAGLPKLRAGKTIPGPDEWRALERRASSFRLRGSAGCIGRPGERPHGI